jgi:hypothetical protein
LATALFIVPVTLHQISLAAGAYLLSAPGVMHREVVTGSQKYQIRIESKFYLFLLDFIKRLNKIIKGSMGEAPFPALAYQHCVPAVLRKGTQRYICRKKCAPRTYIYTWEITCGEKTGYIAKRARV